MAPLNTTANRLGKLLSKMQNAEMSANQASGLAQVDYNGGFDFDSSDFSTPLVRHTNSFIMGVHRWGDPDFVVTN